MTTGLPSSSRPRVSAGPWAGAVLVAVLLLVMALVAGGGGSDEKAQAGAKRKPAGAAAAGRAATPGAPPAVRRAAGRLGPEALVSQLFLVDGREAPVRGADWGAVLGEVRAARPVGARPDGARPVPVLEVSSELPEQAPLARAGLARVRRAYRAAGRRARRAGAGLVLGLSADVGVTAGALSDRTFADDPAEVASRVGAALDALTAERLSVGVAHFPGQGTATQDPLDGPAGVSLTPADLRGRDLIPFAAALQRASAVVVSSATYAAWGDGATPAATSPEVVQRELRGRLGFRGVAMTDDLEGVAVANGSSLGEAAVASLKAGIDLVWVGDEREAFAARRGVLAAIGSRELPAARAREAALRVLELKRRAGVLE